MNRTKSRNDQLLPLVLSFAIQINISSPTQEHLSPKAAGNTRPDVAKTHLGPTVRFFMGILTDLFDSWKDAILIV
jgi:hypothetical protein